jgi:long-subunit acyl-CoA synthetase (AMP-forming)
VITDRRSAGLALLAMTCVGLVGCSSSKSSGVSLTQIENKLKSEPTIQQAESRAPAAAKGVVNTLIVCVAKAMQQQADPAELKKYRPTEPQRLGGKDKGSGDAAANELKNCAGPAVSSAVSSASASVSTAS